MTQPQFNKNKAKASPVSAITLIVGNIIKACASHATSSNTNRTRRPSYLPSASILTDQCMPKVFAGHVTRNNLGSKHLKTSAATTKIVHAK